MAILLYLFTLTVGYITLYAKSPTFGADLENYITLFLWGVSVNIVGVQVIDLKAIYAPRINSLTPKRSRMRVTWAIRASQKPNLYALLIGIDCYLPNQLPGCYYYVSLGGCVRDITHVEEFL